MKRNILLLSSFLITNISFAQNDSIRQYRMPGIFETITTSIKEYKVDTTTPPDDKITRLIIELRGLRGGFNINEAVQYKIEEDRQKNEVPKVEMDKISLFFTSGNGKIWLDNATIWIYRKFFTYNELKQLVTFYKTNAGQKLAANFPVIMLQSLTAADIIKNMYVDKLKQ